MANVPVTPSGHPHLHKKLLEVITQAMTICPLDKNVFLFTKKITTILPNIKQTSVTSASNIFTVLKHWNLHEWSQHKLNIMGQLNKNVCELTGDWRFFSSAEKVWMTAPTDKATDSLNSTLGTFFFIKPWNRHKTIQLKSTINNDNLFIKSKNNLSVSSFRPMLSNTLHAWIKKPQSICL